MENRTQDAWKRKDHPNMKFLWFETLKKDLVPVIRDLSKFIGYSMTESKIKELDEFLHIDTYR